MNKMNIFFKSLATIAASFFAIIGGFSFGVAVATMAYFTINGGF